MGDACDRTASSPQPVDVCVGLVGLGAFGRLAGTTLAGHVREIVGLDPGPAETPPGVRRGALDDLGRCGVVVLAVPLGDFEPALRAVGPALAPGTLVVDVASVKTRPVELMLRHAPSSCRVIGTHPLFGPQTAAEVGLSGQTVALCPARAPRSVVRLLRRFLEHRLGLHAIEISADEHDRQMAMVQAVTHVIGRAATAMALPDLPLATLAYTRLLQLKRNTERDSKALYDTIQHGNAHASDARRRLLDALDRVVRETDGRGADRTPTR